MDRSVKESTYKYGRDIIKKASIYLGHYDVDIDELLTKIEELKSLGYGTDRMMIDTETGGYDDEIIIHLTADKKLEGEELQKALEEQTEAEKVVQKKKEEDELRLLKELKAKYENPPTSQNA